MIFEITRTIEVQTKTEEAANRMVDERLQTVVDTDNAAHVLNYRRVLSFKNATTPATATKPHNLSELRQLIIDAAEAQGLEITGAGDGYSNGEFYDLSIKCEGFEAYLEIKEADEEELEPTEPEEGDYIIFDDRPLGSRYGLRAYRGGYIGTYSTRKEAIRKIRTDIQTYNVWPETWLQDDHGGYTLLTLSSETEDDPDRVEDEVEPAAEDYVLSRPSALTTEVRLVRYEGRLAGTFKNERAALVAVGAMMASQKSFRDVWRVDDQGVFTRITPDTYPTESEHVDGTTPE